MAKMSDDVTVNVTVDTSNAVESLAQLKQMFENIGLALTDAYEKGLKPTIEAIGQVTMPKPPPITPEQIAHAFGVPPEMIGLLPPEAGETVKQAVMDGSLTGEAYVYADGGVLEDWAPYEHSWKDQAIHAWDDTGVLPMGECPANTAPYVPGQLGINSMLVAQQPSGWQTKTTEQIIADIQHDADLYAGKVPKMPKKIFPATEPNPNSPTAGIPAHAVFTSPLIHSQAKAAVEEKAKKLLKATGDVKVSQLDEQGNPTGNWITLGQISDFNLGPLLAMEEIKEVAQAAKAGAAYTVNYPFNDLSQPDTSFHQMLIEEKLKMAAQAENEMLGASLGVDVSKSSGNTITVQSNSADPGVIQVSVTGPDGEPVKQALLSLSEIEAMATSVEKMITIDPIQTGTPWNHQWQEPIGQVTVSDHASGPALDGFVFKDLGHEEAFAEALDQHEKVTKLQAKVFNVLGKDQPVVVTGLPMHSTTHQLAHGATLIEYPDGVATLDLPGTVQTPGEMWSHALHGKFTLATPLARKIAGLDSDPYPQISMASTMLYAAGEPCVWSYQHGWQLLSVVSTGLGQWYDEAGQAISAAEETLFEPVPEPLIHSQAHFWCTACDCHWMAHKGDPVACESGGYLRPSTPLEDKQYLDRRALLKASGLP